jgi:SAM-dependent methyltransferase
MEKLKQIGNVTLNWTFYDELLDGNINAEEETILEILKSGTDLLTALGHDTRPLVYYHLSPRREGILSPMGFKTTDVVLEIGSGMGALTGAIAQKCYSVDCVELSGEYCLANAYRNRLRKNINIHVGNFQDFKSSKNYDIVILIGALRHARKYFFGRYPYECLLKQVFETLNPGGKLYLAVENRLGLKYFAGCREYLLEKPFLGIEGYDVNDDVRTFSHSEIKKLLTKVGFHLLYFYYPFPDYRFPTDIFSDNYLPNASFDPIIINLDHDRIQCFDEVKACRSLIGTEEFKVLSNSFLIEAVKNENAIC